MKRRIKNFISFIKKYYQTRSIQFNISISFTLISVIAMIFLGATLFYRFSVESQNNAIESNKQLVEQVNLNMDTYLKNMMRISNSMYYSVIKNLDLAQVKPDKEMSLLYEANKDNLVSVACFKEDGQLVGAAPVSTVKSGLNVTTQDWYIRANEKIENIQFSTPHVQNLFENSNYRYYWVVSLSRAVELIEDGNTSRGTLLVDMNFSGIEQLFSKVNAKSTGYIYLTNRNGEIIYHPRQQLLYSHIIAENNFSAAAQEDGYYEERFEGVKRSVIVRTVGYTGWKIISVIPTKDAFPNLIEMRFFAVLIIFLFIVIMSFMNLFVSKRIATPIKKLDASVKDLENEKLNLDIYIGGSYEIRHLGKTIKKVVEQMRKLMDDIVIEQEMKRKNELDILQSQINPHFLYNTLDSIVWMIESDRYEEAMAMVTALANLFRISLSKGKNIITIKDELQHVESYLSIQQVRYKDKFEVAIDISPAILECSTIKLILQPIVENAIYYAMEAMIGDGEIKINGYEKNGDIYIDVTDNGLGMPAEMVDQLLSDNAKIKRRGSGIGLRNIHQRITLYFGEEYGLSIFSEPDEGTTIQIHLPKIPYNELSNKEGKANVEK